MIPANLTTGPDYVEEWGIFHNGLIIGVKDNAPDWVKERYHIDSEIIAKACESMHSDENE